MMPTDTPLFGTGPVPIVLTIASVFPAGIVTDFTGNCTCGRSVDSLMTAPPAGAGLSSNTRACSEFPPYPFPGSAMIAKRLTFGGVGPAATVIARLADH